MKKKYDYSSVQFNLPQETADKIVAWGKKNIPDSILYQDYDNPTFGRELESHVTVLYGITSEKSLRVRALLKEQKPFEITLGKISIFDTSDLFDVVKVEVKGTGLFKLNKKFCNGLSYKNKYSKYSPHVTIAYVKHGEGKKFQGATPFEGLKLTVDKVKFSSKNGQKEMIPFNESVQSFVSFLKQVI